MPLVRLRQNCVPLNSTRIAIRFLLNRLAVVVMLRCKMRERALQFNKNSAAEGVEWWRFGVGNACWNAVCGSRMEILFVTIFYRLVVYFCKSLSCIFCKSLSRIFISSCAELSLCHLSHTKRAVSPTIIRRAWQNKESIMKF